MRTLNDIIPPSRRREMDVVNKPIATGREPFGFSEHPPRFPYATLIAIVLVIVASLGALFYFSNATIEVTPSTVSAEVQSSFTTLTGSSTLPFKIITAQKIASQNIKGNGTRAVNASASGTITIYNTQTQSQRLITTTRFATTAGLIFRIRSAVSIPGGTSAKPGSITAKVYADQPGSTYNVGPTSFTIPGFAGTPQASSVYARSSSAMSGGASGNVPVIDAALETQARNALMTALAPDLATSIQEQIPLGYTLLIGAATTTYQELVSAPSPTAGMVEIKEQGTITAVVFPNATLAKIIAASVTSLRYQGEPLILAPTSKLVLVPESAMPDSETSAFSFRLTGTASLIYSVDPTRIATAVSGKTRSDAEVALTNYPEVKRAIIILRPFWRQTFPQDPSSISVTVVNP